MCASCSCRRCWLCRAGACCTLFTRSPHITQKNPYENKSGYGYGDLNATAAAAAPSAAAAQQAVQAASEGGSDEQPAVTPLPKIGHVRAVFLAMLLCVLLLCLCFCAAAARALTPAPNLFHPS